MIVSDKKMTMKELDEWFVKKAPRELEDSLDMRNIQWEKLSYERKLSIYESCL